MTAETRADAVRRDRKRRGLPPTIKDPSVLAVVARLLNSHAALLDPHAAPTRERRKAS